MKSIFRRITHGALMLVVGLIIGQAVGAVGFLIEPNTFNTTARTITIAYFALVGFVMKEDSADFFAAVLGGLAFLFFFWTDWDFNLGEDLISDSVTQFTTSIVLTIVWVVMIVVCYW
jgi:hypothetical protein